MLIIKYCEEAYARLKKQTETNSSGIVCKYCRVIMAKMSEQGLSSRRMAALTDSSRNFVGNIIHTYNNAGIDTVMRTVPKPGRPHCLKAHLEDISGRLDTTPP